MIILQSVIKKQKHEAMKNGELFYKKVRPLNTLSRFLINLFIHRPLVDYTTLPISHIDENHLNTNILKHFEKVYGILNLYDKFPIGLYIHSDTNKNSYTLTFDKKMISSKLVDKFQKDFLSALL
jgi:hypothetical protein